MQGYFGHNSVHLRGTPEDCRDVWGNCYLCTMLSKIQKGESLSLKERLRLVFTLAWPSIMAQLSTIAMQYIDAAMVGRLGADPSASVGLMATSLWMFWGVCSAATVGFAVLVAHRIGAGDEDGARDVFRKAIPAAFAVGAIMAAIGNLIAGPLPRWLGGGDEICGDASAYFRIFTSALPLLSLNYLGCGVLRCVGNMKVPAGVGVMMCALDVAFNFMLIFPSSSYHIFGAEISFPGAAMGVEGAALGTVAAETVAAAAVMYWAVRREPAIALAGPLRRPAPPRRQRKGIDWKLLRSAFRLSLPMMVEHVALTGAQIVTTIIVAPLGTMAIAANAFAVTAEALCYMPGYGMADAATTLTGQSHGAGRLRLARSFGMLTVGAGMVMMTATGILLWLFAPEVMALFTPVEEIRLAGTACLRIEAWAEPMFAASIVAYGAMVGAGDTLVPACMNFGCIWLVRIPLAYFLARAYGLEGVWTGMCVELSLRGLLFLLRLRSRRWLKPTETRSALFDARQ